MTSASTFPLLFCVQLLFFIIVPQEKQSWILNSDFQNLSSTFILLLLIAFVIYFFIHIEYLLLLLLQLCWFPPLEHKWKIILSYWRQTMQRNQSFKSGYACWISFARLQLNQGWDSWEETVCPWQLLAKTHRGVARVRPDWDSGRHLWQSQTRTLAQYRRCPQLGFISLKAWTEHFGLIRYQLHFYRTFRPHANRIKFDWEGNDR